MRIKVNGIELNYDIIGEGKEVILLNPNSVHTKLFMKPIIRLFSKDFKVDFDKYIQAFGDTDIDVVKKRFENVLYELKELKNGFKQK